MVDELYQQRQALAKTLKEEFNKTCLRVGDSETEYEEVRSETAMATRQSKETLLKMLSELDSVFRTIDDMDKVISMKEHKVALLEQ